MDNKTVYYKPLPPKPATLLVMEASGAVRLVSLDGDMRIGRNTPESTCAIRLNSSIVSRDHGEFICADGLYYYKDNKSLNGTYYNGEKLLNINERGSKAVQLNDGDVLRIDRKNLDQPHPEAVVIIFSTTFSVDEKWNRYPLAGKTVVPIGRNIKNGICLTDFMASRNHAIMHKVGDKWQINDNGSTNGLAVNRNEIHDPVMLNPFDIIRIANTTLIFLEDEVLFNSVQVKVEKQDYEQRTVVMKVGIEYSRVGGLFRHRNLLSNIGLDIESGDFILILGGSGAGKTTFINALLGPRGRNGVKNHGIVLLDNMNLYKNFKMLKHKVGLVPQFSTTRDNDTVYHTIKDTADSTLSGEYSNAEIEQRVDVIIQRMMLTSLKNHKICELSGGQKKRVEVAIQAIGDQQVFILDEPDSGMDYATRLDLMTNLKSCTDTGGVVAVISHSPDDAAHLFTKVIVLAKSKRDNVGRLAYYGDVQNALGFFGVNKLSEIVMEINYEGGKGRGDEFIDKFERTRRG